MMRCRISPFFLILSLSHSHLHNLNVCFFFFLLLLCTLKYAVIKDARSTSRSERWCCSSGQSTDRVTTTLVPF